MSTLINKVATLTEAKYTHLLYKLETSHATVYDQLHEYINGLNNYIDSATEVDVTLWNMFLAEWAFYEINDDSPEIFLQCIKQVGESKKIEYRQRLKQYLALVHQPNFLQFTKRIHTRSDASHVKEDNVIIDDGSNSNKNYDLPNKVVVNDSADGYMTNKKVGSDYNRHSDDNTKDSTYNSSMETTDNKDALFQYERYIRNIRNIKLDFVKEFRDCFLHIY